MSLTEVGVLEVEGRNGLLWLSPNDRWLTVFTWAGDDPQFHIVDTQTMKIFRSVDLIQEDFEESVIEIAWTDKSDLLAVAEARFFMRQSDDDQILLRIFEVPDFQEIVRTEVSMPSTGGWGWTGFTGVRFSQDGSRICVDFHGVNNPPDHSAFALSVLNVTDGREIHSFTWTPPCAEAIMNPDMTQYFLIADQYFFYEGADHGHILWRNFIDTETYDELSSDELGISENENPYWAPRLSEDGKTLVIKLDTGGSCLAVDLENWVLRERVPASVFETTPVSSWSQSKHHPGSPRVESSDGHRVYMFEEDTSRVVALESADASRPTDAHDRIESPKKIALELPSHQP